MGGSTRPSAMLEDKLPWTKLVMLGARKGSEVGEGSAVEFEDVWMEWFESGGPEWTVDEGSS